MTAGGIEFSMHPQLHAAVLAQSRPAHVPHPAAMPASHADAFVTPVQTGAVGWHDDVKAPPNAGVPHNCKLQAAATVGAGVGVTVGAGVG